MLTPKGECELTRIAPAAAAELVVDASGLVPLRSDDGEPAEGMPAPGGVGRGAIGGPSRLRSGTACAPPSKAP